MKSISTMDRFEQTPGKHIYHTHLLTHTLSHTSIQVNLMRCTSRLMHTMPRGGKGAWSVYLRISERRTYGTMQARDIWAQSKAQYGVLVVKTLLQDEFETLTIQKTCRYKNGKRKAVVFFMKFNHIQRLQVHNRLVCLD